MRPWSARRWVLHHSLCGQHPGASGPGGPPDFSAAAEALGVDVSQLEDALQAEGGQAADLAKVAKRLGVSLDALQAAILRVKLPYLDGWNQTRRELAAQYRNRLADLPEGASVGLPVEADNVEHIYHLFILRVPDRAAFQTALKAAGVASAVYYPIPLHLTQPGRDQGYKPGDLPVSEQAADHTVAIPLYPEMTPAQVDEVLAAVIHALTPLS